MPNSWCYAWLTYKPAPSLAHGQSAGLCCAPLGGFLEMATTTVDIGILVPIRLPSAVAVEGCLVKLIHQLNRDKAAKFQIVVGYDSDDPVLCRQQVQQHHGGEDGVGMPTTTLSGNLRSRFPGLRDLWVELPPTKPFAACVAWNMLAKAASRAGSDLLLLLGDDVEVVSDTWFQEIVGAFYDISSRRGTTFGVGCVGAVESKSPGWPCFPVLHRFHVDTFGDLFPIASTVEEARSGCGFYNQDADPFLWEVYRRFGLTAWTPTIVLENTEGGVIGGLSEMVRHTRYDPVHVEWRLGMLDEYLKRLQKALPGGDQREQVTMDVVVPSYRVNVDQLRYVLNLRTSPVLGAQIRFVIIVDRPLTELSVETRRALREIEREQRDVRIRCNRINAGASAARSWGAADCHSAWILYLDDDVVPHADLLNEYVRAIRRHGRDDRVRGFVGTTQLDFRLQKSTMAFHMAQVSCFWHIAEWLDRPPWGVTANLLLRWWPGLSFDTRFPKTGGGEDIDICVKARWQTPGGTLLAVPRARAVHPWWDDGASWTLLRRAFWWADGDSMLLTKYPVYTYQGIPNIIEVTALVLVVVAVVPSWWRAMLASLIGTWTADYVTGYIYCLRDGRFHGASSWLLFCARLESSTILQASEFGRFYGNVRRAELKNICARRFDWFLGTRPEVISEQRIRDSVFLALSIFLAVALYHFPGSQTNMYFWKVISTSSRILFFKWQAY